MDIVVRPARKPRLDLGSFVGGIVIHDNMDIEAFRDSSVDAHRVAALVT